MSKKKEKRETRERERGRRVLWVREDGFFIK